MIVRREASSVGRGTGFANPTAFRHAARQLATHVFAPHASPLTPHERQR
jgi:hypothetical protein